MCKGIRVLEALKFALALALIPGTALAATQEDVWIPLQAWVHDPVIASVRVSPDGKRLAALTLQNVNEAAQVTVWNTNELNAEPSSRFAPKEAKAFFVTWLSNKALAVVGRQKFDFRTGGKPTRWFRNLIYIYTLGPDNQVARELQLLDKEEIIGFAIENRLTLKPDKALIRIISREFVADLYELDLNNFRTRRVHRGSPKSAAFTNFRGEVMTKTEFEGGGKRGPHFRYSYQHPETGKWEHHHSVYAKEREGMTPVAQDRDGRTLYMLDNTGRDKYVLRKYDLATRELSEPIFGDPGFEVSGVVQSQLPDSYGEIAGFVYADDRVRREWVHPQWKSLYEMLEGALPAGQTHLVVSSSDDWNRLVIRSTGDREASSYYLLSNRKELMPLGRAYPHLDPDKLSDMRYVEYAARDGLTIPAYLTLPRYGEAPHAAVVLPHGGPWARDYWGWDPWVQFLANRGYAVLQPNYRGSEGFGQKLWRAGDREWGQKMQDDKDDGAAWLVDQGIADADRIAIFGYSYGGYAAMAAAVRPNSPFQCAIAGAGLSELRTFDKITFENPYNREYQNPTVAGLSPLDHVKSANIPIYLFHGDRDQRVPVEQSRKYYRALRRAGATVEYNEIPDLWHSGPWWPTHYMNLYENLEDYLANRCGPGGL